MANSDLCFSEKFSTKVEEGYYEGGVIPGNLGKQML